MKFFLHALFMHYGVRSNSGLSNEPASCYVNRWSQKTIHGHKKVCLAQNIFIDSIVWNMVKSCFIASFSQRFYILEMPNKASYGSEM